jgi:predicted DCC family thiol-disulfide oxidoreductase YuxK
MSKCNVFYDGSCPLCTREIKFYSKFDDNTNICWIDISDENIPVPNGFERSTLLSKFHVQDKSGVWHDGSSGFFAVWNELNGFKWLGSLGKYKIVIFISDILYKIFLYVRPLIQLPIRIYDLIFKKDNK